MQAKVKILIVEPNAILKDLIIKKINESLEIDSEIEFIFDLQMFSFENQDFDIIIFNPKLKTKSILDLKRIKKLVPNTPVLIITENHNYKFARTLVKEEAEDFLMYNHLSSISIEKSILYSITKFKLKDTHKKLKVQEINATHDNLTNLPNRHMLNEILELKVQQAKREEQLFAVLFINLDNFKFINDNFGYRYGDKILQKISERLAKKIRTSDFIARFGTDEFVVILNKINSPEDGHSVGLNLIEQTKMPIQIGQESHNLDSTIGISLFPHDGNSSEELIKNASAAMRSFKRNSKGNCGFYNKHMNEKAEEKFRLHNDLRAGLQKNQFSVYYQPQINFTKNKICGFEALVRWNHESLGLISPEKFISFSEKTGFIIPLGNFILKESCIWFKENLQSNYPDAKISINVSLKQLFIPSFIEHLLERLEYVKIPPKNVTLELTESLFSNNIDKMIHILKILKRLGLSIAIDDFGTGYSSLSYLEKLPIDIIKIDRSFINYIAKNNRSKNLIKTIIAIAENLDLDLVAEGIEEKEQAVLLQDLGCNIMQGYYFGHPMANEKAIEYIKSFKNDSFKN